MLGIKLINVRKRGPRPQDKRTQDGKLDHSDPFYLHGLTLIICRKNNYLPGKVCGKITHASPDFDSRTDKVWEGISKIILHFIKRCNTLSVLGSMLIHMSKKGIWCEIQIVIKSTEIHNICSYTHTTGETWISVHRSQQREDVSCPGQHNNILSQTSEFIQSMLLCWSGHDSLDDHYWGFCICLVEQRLHKLATKWTSICKPLSKRITVDSCWLSISVCFFFRFQMKHKL